MAERTLAPPSTGEWAGRAVSLRRQGLPPCSSQRVFLTLLVGILARPPVPGGSLGVPGEGAHHLLEHGNLFHCCLACFLAAVCGSALASSVAYIVAAARARTRSDWCPEKC